MGQVQVWMDGDGRLPFACVVSWMDGSGFRTPTPSSSAYVLVSPLGKEDDPFPMRSSAVHRRGPSLGRIPASDFLLLACSFRASQGGVSGGSEGWGGLDPRRRFLVPPWVNFSLKKGAMAMAGGAQGALRRTSTELEEEAMAVSGAKEGHERVANGGKSEGRDRDVIQADGGRSTSTRASTTTHEAMHGDDGSGRACDASALEGASDGVEDQDAPLKRRGPMWETLPDHVLSHILHLLLDSENTWPGRASVVAATGVCRRWRKVAVQACLSRSWKELESQVAIVHPLQLLEIGPRMEAIRCFIKREKVSKGVFFYYKYSMFMVDEHGYGGGKFLMTGRTSPGGKIVVSFTRSDGNSTTIGCLKVKRGGRKFVLYASDEVDIFNKDKPLVCIEYAQGESGTGPRRVAVTTWSGACEEARDQCEVSKRGLPQQGCREGSSREHREDSFPAQLEEEDSVRLFSRKPKWHSSTNCWCLDFQGRVTQASVKNMQLCMHQDDAENALQFGKVGRNLFTLDFGHPFSALTSFAVALSSFHARILSS